MQLRSSGLCVQCHLKITGSAKPMWEPLKEIFKISLNRNINENRDIRRHGSLPRERDPGAAVKQSLPRLTLERAIGEDAGKDTDLWKLGQFDASVYPDLPIIGTSLNESIEECIKHGVEENREGAFWSVRTVAAQTLDKVDLIKKIKAFSGLFTSYNSNGALLFVSGGDPSRKLPFLKDRCLDSVYLLQMAESMRQSGEIPEDISFWAVGNPMTDSSSRLKEKADAGAVTILTQPPFLRKPSEQWFQNVDGTTVNMLIGIPMITSRKSLRFWLQLCGVGFHPEAEPLLQSFPLKKTGNVEEYNEVVTRWNVDFIEYVRSKCIVPSIKTFFSFHH